MTTETAARRLKEVRVGAGLGREKCARLAGIDRPLLYRYEAGLRKPGITNAARLARVLDVRVDEVEEFLPAVQEAGAAGFTLAETNGHSERED